METEAAFDGAEFLGLARRARRDPHRLLLLARTFDPGERGRVVIPVPGGTLIATNRRLLELRPHLEVDGAWNVRELTGYSVSRQVLLADVRDVRRHKGAPAVGPSGYRDVDDVLELETTDATETFLLSRGPKPVLTDDEFSRLAEAVLPQAK